MLKENLHEYCDQLTRLLGALPEHNSYKSVSQLNQVFNQYLKILDSVNSYNEIYRSATRIFYAGITDIRDNMQELLNADSFRNRERAFEKAKDELANDLQALATLLNPEVAGVLC